MKNLKLKVLIGAFSLCFVFSSFAQVNPPEQKYALRFFRDRFALAPQNQTLNLGDEFTLEAWVNPLGYRPDAVILSKSLNAECNIGYKILLNLEGKIEFQISQGTWNSHANIESIDPISLNKWTHIAATLSEGKMRLYINCAKVGEKEYQGSPSNDNNVLSIGNKYLNGIHDGNGFWGIISHVKIWDKALNLQELLNQSSINLTGCENGLIAYWPLNEGKGQITKDLTANASHLTLGDNQSDIIGDPQWGLTKIINNGPYFELFDYSYSSPYIDWSLNDGILMDIDTDGDLDFLAIQINWDTWQETPAYAFINNGNAVFEDKTEQVFANGKAYSIGANKILSADFNNDGRSDAYLGDQGMDKAPFPGRRNTLLIQISDGIFENKSFTNLPGYDNSFTHDIALGDVDNDEDIDIYNSNIWGLKTPTLFINDGSGNFIDGSDQIPLTNHDNEAYCASLFVDVDKDGDNDLILGACAGEISDKILINNGDGHFKIAEEGCMPTRYPMAYSLITEIISNDINGDGWMDLVYVVATHGNYEDNYVLLLLNNRNGTFSYANKQKLLFRSYRNPFNLELNDINFDGWVDLLIGVDMELSQVYLNNGDATFTDASFLLPVSSSVCPLLSGDLDNDGDIDLFSLSAHDKPYYVYKNIKTCSLDIVPLNVPEKPVLVSPINGESVNKSPMLKWQSDKKTVAVQIQIAPDAEFANIIFEKSNISAHDKLKINLNKEQTLYWRIRGTNTAGTGEWSEIQYFKSANVLPDSIELSNNVIYGNTSPGTVVGFFTTWDNDNNDNHTYSLVEGDGKNDIDNTSFIIKGDTLKTNASVSDLKEYLFINVKVDDGNGGTFTQSFSISTLPSGLVACYPFHGNANNMCGEGANGTVNGPVLTSDRFGTENSAYNFEGSSGLNIYLGTRLALINNSDSFSICSWIYPTELSSNQGKQYTILGERKGGDNYQFAVMDNRLYFSYWEGDSEFTYTGTSIIEINKWQFVVVTFNCNQIRLYINGVLDLTDNTQGKINNNPSDLYIGSFDGDNAVFNGKLDDIVIYNRCLSEHEINEKFKEQNIINEVKKISLSDNIKIYPNPADGILNIKIHGLNELCTISIINSLGQLVHQLKSIESNTTKTINLHNKIPGVYYVWIQTNTKRIVKKLIVK